jgi:AcrR family transcriptional regulator
MLAVVNADGYEGANVANVTGHAGVSRTSFYEYFIDKDDCFLAVYQEIARTLLESIGLAVNGSPAERATHVVVDQLIKYAETGPVQARFLFSDALAGGPRALHERERAIGQITSKVQTAHANASAQAHAPDLPTAPVIGATQQLIAQAMRRGEHQHTQLGEELSQWLTRYDQPIGEHHWSTLGPEPLAAPCLDVAQLSHQTPSPEASETTPLFSSELALDNRSRILVAAAESALQGGYDTSSLTAIMQRAGLRKAAFYDHFADKRQAFLILHELAVQQSMAVGAGAYFTAPRWPERVWRCLLATTQLYAAQPALAHVGFVEAHALGPPAIQRLEETRHAFTALLQADNQHASTLPSTTATEAIGATTFEIVHERARQQRIKELPCYTYHATYLALAPFLGVQAANRFVQRKLDKAEDRG